MKLRAGQKIHYEAGPNMTPLVDIVMVILIFLMLTGTFAVGEHWLQSNLPLVKQGAGNAEVPKDYVPDTPVSIDVWSDGESWTATVEGSPNNRYHTRAALADELKRKRASLLKAEQEADKIQVYIRPKLATKYRHIVEVYDAAVEAELKKVAFTVAEQAG